MYRWTHNTPYANTKISLIIFIHTFQSHISNILASKILHYMTEIHNNQLRLIPSAFSSLSALKVHYTTSVPQQVTHKTRQAAFVSPWAAQHFPKPRAKTTLVTVRDCSKVTPTKVLCKVLRLIYLKLSGERLRCRGEPILERKTEAAVIIMLRRFAFATKLCSFCGEEKKARVKSTRHCVIWKTTF